MMDYIIKSNIKIEFDITMCQNGTDQFDVEAKVEKLIRMSLEKSLNQFKDKKNKIYIEIKSNAQLVDDLKPNEKLM